MKVAITANENTLNATTERRFGRSKWYCIFDTETGKTEFLENIFAHGDKSKICGVAQYLDEMNVKMVIAEHFGSKSIYYFRENNIQVVMLHDSKSIKEIINQINSKNESHTKN